MLILRLFCRLEFTPGWNQGFALELQARKYLSEAMATSLFILRIIVKQTNVKKFTNRTLWAKYCRLLLAAATLSLLN